ncbi:MAG: sulfite exporter TauE/SafE family protein [Bacteroidia bacterium]
MDYFFLLLIPIIAFLYASVGHGGASGYLALMVLFGISPVLMKPSALVLNIFVSAIALFQYFRQEHFKWKILLPFILLSIPLSFLGAKIQIDVHTYKLILAGCLVIATLRILGFSDKSSEEGIKELKFVPALLIGGLLGFVSGLIGIGGGILLSPVLLILHWANMKQTAAVSAAFIFLNSISGLAGASLSSQSFSPEIYIWAGLAIVGGTGGAWYGSRKFSPVVLKYVLSMVLFSACIKLILS